ncbi:MAG: NAD(+)/NADH kinase [Oscillospiraceae bacterium]|nr:NAD(+)/NADH kinase [Oscillospiraceae bacterium]
MIKAGIIPNLTREKAESVTYAVTDMLERLNIEYIFEPDTKSVFGNRFTYSENLYKYADVVIAIGGDGSFIHTAKQCAIAGKPVLCINAGNLAFLAGLEANELELLKSLLNGNYTKEKHMMLKCYLETDGKSEMIGYCLNDIAVARGKAFNVLNFNAYCDDKIVNFYRADGIIVSTPTGSTAYSWSAGGPVIDPALSCIIMTPLCTHSPLNRSMVFNSSSKISITAPDNGNKDIVISLDGETNIDLPQNGKVIIEKSDISAEFIRIKSDEFFDVLNRKLTQRRVER